jgi:DNA-binding MarR family transcriptional regulator
VTGGSGPKVVAWDHKFGHVRAMARSNKASYGKAAPGQPASAGDVADEAAIGPASASEQAPLKLEKFLPYQLNVVASLVSLALSRVYARRYGIGVPEWRVLVTLGQYGVMTGKAIGAHTHMHKTKVSRAVALMEERKLLVRRANRADMRESFLSLTAAGRTMYEEVAPHALDFTRRLTEILTPADREAFNRALKQLTERSAELVAESVNETDDMDREDLDREDLDHDD